MEIKDKYIIYQPKTSTNKVKSSGKEETGKASPLTTESMNKNLSSLYNFYQGKETKFTPVSEKISKPQTEVKTPEPQTEVKTPANTEKTSKPQTEVKTPANTEKTSKPQTEVKTPANTEKTSQTQKAETKKTDESKDKNKIFTEDHIIKEDQYPGIHMLKEVKLNKRSIKQLEKKFPPEKLKILDGLRNKKFSKEELTTELLKKNFTREEIDTVMKETYKPEGGKFKEIEGAPNYRKTKGIHGTGQPTVEGLRKVLDEAGGKGKEIRWINLREEPVIYINGKPHNLRLKSKPTENLKQDGLTGEQVEKQEDQLKKELMEEVKKNGGYITLYEEVKKDGKWVTVPKKVKVSEADIKTTKEVFQDMEKEGYKVNYKRIPVTDEFAPEKKDFDELVNTLKNDDPDSPLVFNCHAGRGRTTTGTVIADVMRSAKEEDSSIWGSIRNNKAFRLLFREFAGNTGGEGNRLRSVLSLIDTFHQAKTPEDVDKVINTLKGNTSANENTANEAIDRRGQIINLREATIKQLEKFKDDPKAKEKADNFLRRYFKVVAFQEYVKETGGKGYNPPFSEWLDNNKQLNDMNNRVQLAFNTTHGESVMATA